MAGVIVQQGINTDGELAGQVVIDDGIGQRDQHAMLAVCAFDAPLVAHASAPFVGAGRRIARLAGGLTLPADWVDVVSAAEQTTE